MDEKPFRFMHKTETPTILNLDNIYPGLQIVDKVHPPQGEYNTPSYEQIAGLEYQGGKFARLIPKSDNQLEF